MDGRAEADTDAAIRERAADAGVPYAQLTTEERVERTRQVVAILDRRIAGLQHVVDQLVQHQHAPDGRLVAPMRLGFPDGRQVPGAPDPEAWF